MGKGLPVYLGSIYALIDPRTKRMRYVGQTVHAWSRYKQHIGRYVEHGAIGKWLEELSLEYLLPKQIILERCAIKKLPEREQHFIDKYRELGEPLLNSVRAHRASYSNKSSYFIECVETGERFESYTEAGRHVDVSGSTIKNRCDDGRETYPSRLRFRRVERR